MVEGSARKSNWWRSMELGNCRWHSVTGAQHGENKAEETGKRAIIQGLISHVKRLTFLCGQALKVSSWVVTWSDFALERSLWWLVGEWIGEGIGGKSQQSDKKCLNIPHQYLKNFRYLTYPNFLSSYLRRRFLLLSKASSLYNLGSRLV